MSPSESSPVEFPTGGGKGLLPALQKYVTEGNSLGKFAEECNALGLEPGDRTIKQVVVRAPNGHPIFIVTTEQGLESLQKLKNKVGETE